MTAVTKMRADDVAPRRARMLTGGKWVDDASGIVFPDANEDWVIDGIIVAMRFTRQSQSQGAQARRSAR